MNSLPRTLSLSLLLHCAAFFLAVNFAATEEKRPIVVDLSLLQLAGGPEGEAGQITAKDSSKAVSATGASRATMTATSRQAKPAAENATLAKAVEQAPQAAPQQAPAAPVINAQAQPSRPTAALAATQGAGSAATPGPTGGLSEKSSAGGGSGQAGSPSGSDNGGGYGNGRGNSVEQLGKKYISENYAYIAKKIQDHIVYPAKARREGLTGKAFVSFFIQEDGQVANIKVLRSTGYEILDANLVKTIRDVAPFPKPPKRRELQMPFTYRLEQ